MAEDGQPPVSASPDATLAALYKSARPAVELLPGVSLSALINTCWLPGDAKAMLAETWIPAPPEEVEGAAPPAPPPAFDPAAIEYTDLQKRLSRSAPLVRWNDLTIKIKVAEQEVEKIKDAAERDAKAAEVEQFKAQLAEAEGQIAELKASFQEDPLSLVPWMASLFALADAGLTTFEVGGPFFPHTQLRALFSSDNSASFYEGAEKILGTFKRRYERERGPGKIQVLTRLVPNMFQDGYSAAQVEPLVEKVRANVSGNPEPTDPLDFLQLYWWDLKEHEVLPTLKALQKLTEDKLDINEESGEVSVAEPKKIKGIGLVDFPSRAIISAIQSGVPVTSLSIPFSVADRSYGKALATARQYNIKVIARDGLMGGVISEKYLGAPCPDTAVADPDLDDVGHALEIVNNYGGWDKVQKLLSAIKSVADKHGVKMQTVALRWLIDNGTFPCVTTRWGAKTWSQFGFNSWAGETPGIDWQVFQVESFLEAGDAKLLNSLGAVPPS